MNRVWIPLGILILAIPLATSPIFAHGILKSSSPSAGASLPSAPREVVLTFNEPIDRVFSTAAVVDGAGTRISGGAAVSRDGRQITVAVEDLPAGTYAVRWRVLSAVDGHTTSGFFTFTVAAPAAVVGQPSPAPLPPAAQEPPPKLLVAMRWLAFAAALTLAGTAFFHVFVIRPAVTSLGSVVGAPTGGRAATLLHGISRAAAALLLVSMSAEFLLQAAIILDTSVSGVVRSGLLWLLLGGTRPGWGAMIRGAMAIILLLPVTPAGRILRASGLVWFVIVATVSAILGGPAAVTGSTHAVLIVLVGTVYGLLSILAAVIVPRMPEVRVPEGRWVEPIAAGILLAGITVSSHAVGRGPVAMAGDWLHLAAASAWVGGLLPLLLTLLITSPVDRATVARAVVPRFSGLAAISLVALGITGIYNAWIHIPSLRAIVQTAYGRTLAVKVALVLPLLLLGALNRFVLRPRIGRGAHPARAVHVFTRSVAGEVVLALAVLLTVASLTITPPASVTAPAPTQPSVVLAGLANELQVRLAIVPETATARYEVLVVDPRGRPLDAAVAVQVRLTRLDAAVPPAVLVLSHRGEGRFERTGEILPAPSWWEITVTVSRGDRALSTTFPLRTGGSRRRASDTDAVRVLDRARRTIQTVRSWREEEQITDGVGNVVLTQYEIVRPDRLRYRTSAGTEAIIVGETRYLRERGGAWVTDTLAQPLILGGPYLSLLTDPRAVELGRAENCAGEVCQVVLWESADGSASFAARVGATSNQVYGLLMVAPSHYMTSRPFDFSAPISIEPP